MKTNLMVQQIEDWLADNCSKYWELRMEGVIEDTAKRMVAVYFESKDELNTFKQALQDQQIQ
jgi:hypothetical protein